MHFTKKSDVILMIGLDFGSTTSSAMVASAKMGHSSLNGRMAFGSPRVIYHSKPVFTPFNEDDIDSVKVESFIDQWIMESGLDCKRIFSGGAIVTGLAAQKSNAAALTALVRKKIGRAVIATADDPSLESWFAFMGNSMMLSRLYPEVPFINLDIGGGTTNPAYGQNGNVIHTGCCFVGARHFQFKPGTYQLKAMSVYGRRLIKALSISKRTGDTLSPDEIDAIVGFYINALEALVTGDRNFFLSPIAGFYQQVQFKFHRIGPAPVVTFSGGVGALVYRHIRGIQLPGTTCFGDLGIDLARRIVASPILSGFLKTRIPENMGRATVYGLALHSTEISGTTLFLSKTDTLPRNDLPIVARLSVDADDAQLENALHLVKTSSKGACIQILAGRGDTDEKGVIKVPVCESLSTVKNLGLRLAETISRVNINPRQPIVILVPGNYGQVLGNYASNWRQSKNNFIVIDEIPDRHAQFVNIGKARNTVVPVSFYGMP